MDVVKCNMQVSPGLFVLAWLLCCICSECRGARPGSWLPAVGPEGGGTCLACLQVPAIMIHCTWLIPDRCSERRWALSACPVQQASLLQPAPLHSSNPHSNKLHLGTACDRSLHSRLAAALPGSCTCRETWPSCRPTLASTRALPQASASPTARVASRGWCVAGRQRWLVIPSRARASSGCTSTSSSKRPSAQEQATWHACGALCPMVWASLGN